MPHYQTLLKYPDYGQDDLTKTLLERLPGETGPSDAASLKPPMWGDRMPPQTHQFGYTGGGFLGKFMGMGGKKLEY